jgi:hypothetical protein
VLILAPIRFVSEAARVLGRGAEGRCLAEKIGAVMDGAGMRLIHYAALGGSLPVCRYLLEDLGLDVDVDGPSPGASPSMPFLKYLLTSVRRNIILVLIVHQRSSLFRPMGWICPN